MGEVAAILVAALGGGVLASMLRLPPLVGFLAAGFVLSALGVDRPEDLDVVSDLGVALLLFGIGLKLDVRTLLRREVWLTASVHLVVSVLVGTAFLLGLGALGVGLLQGEDLGTFAMLAFALSFSSTVFVVKVLEERGSAQSLGGRTAIGILIFQDLAAVVFLSASHGELPSPWAASLLLLLPGAYLLRFVLGALGHDELQPLFGLTVALVPGYALFDAVGFKGELGALVVGALLAFHPGAGDLSKSLFVVKELLLVGFFVSIGFIGLPSVGDLLVVVLLLLLLALKAVGFSLLLWVLGLRRRTAAITGVTLTNFSEFGLIVAVGVSADLLGEGWLVVLATAIAASFTLSAALGRRSELVVAVAKRALPERLPDRIHPEDRPIDVAHAQAVVLGMGRVGRATYDRLRGEYGLVVMGVESLETRVQHLAALGYDVIEADATDPEFWTRLATDGVEIAILAMPFHGNNLNALRRLTESGFAGTVAVVAQFDRDLEQSLSHGADTGIQLYEGAGSELADRAAAAARVAPAADDGVTE